MKEYNKDRIYDIMDTTQTNYEHMFKRLKRKAKFSSFVLTYYSIALIVYTLTPKYYPQYYNSDLSEYFSVIISVVILAYSIINGNAKYNERIKSAESAVNSVKNIKRGLTDQNLEQKKMEYHNITIVTEYSSDVDFFQTIKKKCKEYDIRWYAYKKDIKEKRTELNKYEMDKLNNYLSEILPFVQQTKIICDYLLTGFVVLMPITIFVLCFLK